MILKLTNSFLLFSCLLSCSVGSVKRQQLAHQLAQVQALHTKAQLLHFALVLALVAVAFALVQVVLPVCLYSILYVCTLNRELFIVYRNMGMTYFLLILVYSYF